MPDSTAAPLILTLSLDEAAQTYFDALRRQHFPPKINYLSAHLTLFHHLPGTDRAAIDEQLRAICHTQRPLPLQVSGLRSLGRGVAFTLQNNELPSLHRRLQQAFAAHLTPQDQQKLQPHVTIQNKADPAAARQLLAGLQAGFTPFTALGTGLHLWAYQGGPWKTLAHFPFASLPDGF